MTPMKNARRLISLVCCAGLGFALAACSPETPNDETTDQRASSEETRAPAETQKVLDNGDCVDCASTEGAIFDWMPAEGDPQQTRYVRVNNTGAAVRLVGRGDGEARDNSGGHTSGAFFTLSGDAEAMASGKTVRVEVEVRGSEGQVLAVAYSTADVGNSGWQEFTLSGNREWVSFDYPVNPMREGNNDYVGLLPAEGEDVRLYRFRVLEAAG